MKITKLGAIGMAGVALCAWGVLRPQMKALDAAEQERVVGAVNWICFDTGATCDWIQDEPSAGQCGITLSNGNICMSCQVWQHTDESCVQHATASCEPVGTDKDCGSKWLGTCNGVSCENELQSLPGDCEDANDCN